MGRKKCIRSLAELPCLVSDHSSYICSVVMDANSSPEIHFLCPECKFEGLLDKMVNGSHSKIYSLSEFLDFLFDSHSSKSISQKVFSDETSDSISSILKDCIEEIFQEKSSLLIFIDSFFDSLHESCMQTLEANLSQLKKESTKQLIDFFESKSRPFKSMGDVFLYKKSLCHQIIECPLDRLKQFISNYIKDQNELKKSEGLLLFHYQNHIQNFQAILASEKPFNSFLPRISTGLGTKVKEEIESLKEKILVSYGEMFEQTKKLTSKWIETPSFQEMPGQDFAQEISCLKEGIQTGELFPSISLKGSFGSILNFEDTQRIKEENQMKEKITLDVREASDITGLMLIQPNIETLNMKPLSNSDEYWMGTKRELEKAGIVARHLIVSASDSEFTSFHAKQLQEIIHRQENLRTLAISLKKYGKNFFA